MNSFSIIGKPTAMVDAAEKTTGAGKYTDDLSVPGMLIGKILHSPYPHARIKRIDTSHAEALDGVVTVATGKDAPNPYGILPVGHDEHALALDKVRYVGDNIACVVAVSEAIAEKALELIDVEYEVLPAYFDPEESMRAQTNLIHDNKPGNLEKDYHHAFGDPDKGFAEADQLAEARFIANEVTHAAMEPHSTLASFELDPHTGKLGRLTVWSSTQVPYYLQHKFSLVLETADVADSCDQAARRWRIWGQERSHPAGNHRRDCGAQSAGSGKDHVYPGRSVLGASRAASHHHRSQNRNPE